MDLGLYPPGRARRLARPRLGHRQARRVRRPTSSATSACPGSSCSWRPRARASRSRPRRRCCSPASTSPRASTRWSRRSLVGSIANLVGSWIAYAVGYYGRIELLEKHGRKLHIKPSHLQWADRWFEKYGASAVFFSRMLPIIRTFISLPAGVARMPFWRFTVLTLAGCVPWIFALTFIGQQVGDELGELEGLAALRRLRGRAC